MAVDSSSEAGEEDVVALAARPDRTPSTGRRPDAVPDAVGRLEAPAARDENLCLRSADVDETESFPSSSTALRQLCQLPAHGQRKKEQHQPHRPAIFTQATIEVDSLTRDSLRSVATRGVCERLVSFIPLLMCNISQFAPHYRFSVVSFLKCPFVLSSLMQHRKDGL